MGLAAIPFAVDIEKAKKVFGSKDQILFDNVKKDGYYINYDEQSRIGIEFELEDIIFNFNPIELRTPTKPKLFGLISGNDGSGMYGNWENYSYVLMAICNIIGHNISLNNEIFYYGRDWEMLNSVLRKNGSNLDLDRMTQYNKIFDATFEKSAVVISYYNKQEVKDFLQEVNKIESLVNEEYAELIELHSVLKAGLKYCFDNNCEWVSFFC